MGYGLLIAGAAFLIIPSVGIYDFFPDFIGYFLIGLSLYKTSMLDGRLENAKKQFSRLFWLTAAKFILMFALISLNDETTSMLCTFTFAIAEAILLWSASGELMEGLYYINSRTGSSAPDRDYSGVKLIFRVFIIARAVLVSIPELVVMANDDYQSEIDIENGISGTLYDSRGIILAACVLLSAAIGIVFYVKFVSYVRGLKKDAEACGQIRKRYNDEILSNTGLITCKKVKDGFSYICAGMFFMVCLQFYGVDVLPDFAAAFLIMAGLLVMKSVIPGAGKAALFAGITGGCGILSYALMFYTANKYYHASYVLSVNAVRMYTISAAAQAVFCVLFMITLFKTAPVLNNISGMIPSPSIGVNDYGEQLRGKNTLLIALGIAAAAIYSAIPFLAMYFEEAWLIGALIFSVYSIAFLISLNKLTDLLENKIR